MNIMSGSNTVEACITKFLCSKHYEEFMANNPWMSPEQGAVVFFRRHTAGKMAYASYKDLPNETQTEWDHYISEARKQAANNWHQIPVSQKQVAKIRQRTLEKYASFIYQDEGIN